MCFPWSWSKSWADWFKKWQWVYQQFKHVLQSVLILADPCVITQSLEKKINLQRRGDPFTSCPLTVCVCACASVWRGGGGGSLLCLRSVYRLQVMPGPDKRSPIPARCLDSACDSTGGTGLSRIYDRFFFFSNSFFFSAREIVNDRRPIPARTKPHEMERGDSASAASRTTWGPILELHERAELDVLRGMTASTPGQRNPSKHTLIGPDWSLLLKLQIRNKNVSFRGKFVSMKASDLF